MVCCCMKLNNSNWQALCAKGNKKIKCQTFEKARACYCLVLGLPYQLHPLLVVWTPHTTANNSLEPLSHSSKSFVQRFSGLFACLRIVDHIITNEKIHFKKQLRIIR